MPRRRLSRLEKSQITPSDDETKDELEKGLSPQKTKRSADPKRLKLPPRTVISKLRTLEATATDDEDEEDVLWH